MTVAFPDLSNFQAGLRIQPGTVAVVAKATEGNYYEDRSYLSFKQQTANEGGVFSSYHYLRSGYGAAQAQYWHNYVGPGVPGMLDVEQGSGGVADILDFKREADNLGARVWGAYLPHWYWQQIGSPDLTPLAAAGLALVSSNYTAYSDNGPGWYPYGGLVPEVWQWTNALRYGGQSVDFNAFKGDAVQLAELINGHSGPPGQPVKPVVSVSIVDMCARSDPSAPQGHTTNFNQVFPVQEALVDEGYLAVSNPYWGRGSFGSMTVAAYREFQVACGYSGAAADGIPGMSSLVKLGVATGRFSVVA